MFDRIISNYTSFFLKPLNFARSVSVTSWTVIWSFVFALLGLEINSDVVYLAMEYHNSLIAGGC